MAETTICKQCVHYLVCMHFSATRKECKQFQAETNLVEVVRCKECKHYVDSPYDNEDMMCDRWGEWIFPNDDDFCSCGERKDNG